jgi:hypothetical protein
MLVFEEASRLVHQPVQQPATTLIAVPHLADFGDFLDSTTAAEMLLEDAGFAGRIQVATFHPRYQFDGLETDDPANHTNRSPVAILHLLRESDVTRAVRAHPDPGAIPQRNIHHLRTLGAQAAQQLSWGEDFTP